MISVSSNVAAGYSGWLSCNETLMKMLDNLAWRGKGGGTWERGEEEAKVGKHQLLFQMILTGRHSCPLHPALLPPPSPPPTTPFGDQFGKTTVMKIYYHDSSLIHCCPTDQVPKRTSPSLRVDKSVSLHHARQLPILSVMFMILWKGEAGRGCCDCGSHRNPISELWKWRAATFIGI